MSTVEAGKVLMTGENSFIRLSKDGGSTLTNRTSHWRVLWCPAGSGHALFILGELSDHQVRIYSDNIAVARWLQTNIESVLFPDFGNLDTPVTAAVFEQMGDAHSTTSELIESDDDVIRMQWYDTLEPFVINAPGSATGRPIGVITTFFPAKSAQLTLNSTVGAGSPWLEPREDRQSSSAVLAWSETWLKV
jgi:hypothetical protein